MDTGIVDNLQKNIHQNTLIYHNAEIFPGIFSVAAPVIRKQKVYRCAKRGFDIFFSVVLGIVLIVPMLIIAILIRWDSPGTIIFKQERLGKNGKQFVIWKFRSMRMDAEEKGPQWAKKEDDRCTRIGRVLRNTRLDELPQLINILKGEMSFIGPRPVVEDELEKYGPNKEKFLSVKPGLTGYWASHGRSSTSYEDRMKLELYYVDHASLWMDIKIFFKTFSVIMTHEGAW